MSFDPDAQIELPQSSPLSSSLLLPSSPPTSPPTSPGKQLTVSARFDPLIDAASATQPFRLGLYGGTFDPVHIGHLHIAERAREQFSLDGVLFMPAGKPAHKLSAGVTEGKDRYSMLQAALVNQTAYDVSSIEIDRSGTSYTIDTLRAIHERYRGKARLFFIAGVDMIADMRNWKEPGEIAKLAIMLGAQRTIPPEEQEAFLRNSNGFDIRIVDSMLIDLSSSGIRESVRQGKSIQYLVPETVCSYIRQQGLYREQG